MTHKDMIDKIKTTGRVLKKNETWHSGMILPDGSFMAIRQTDYSEIHEKILNEVGLTLETLMKNGCVRKINNNYQLDMDNQLAKELIEVDLSVTAHKPQDIIHISNRIDGYFNLNFSYQDFVDNGFKLPNPKRDSYFL